MFMANVNKIKYVPGNDILDGALTNNNIALGVDMGLDYGPTMDSGYYQGVTPSNNSGYTIYHLNGEEQPRIVVAKDDDALIFFANSFGNQTYTNVTDAINWFKDTPGYFVTNGRYGSITTSGMTIMYDPSLPQSYPRGGNSMDNLGSLAVGNEDPQMYFNENGAPVEFVNEKGGTLRFHNYGDGDGSYATTSYNGSSNDFTYNVWFKASSFTSPSGWNVLTSRGNYQQLGIYADGSGISFYDGNFNINMYADNTIIIGKWHNAVVRHIEGVTTQLYLDNVLISEDTTNVNLYNESMNEFTIACSDTQPDYFDGQIGHVGYYERALTNDEISKNFTGLKERYYGLGESMMFMSKMTTNDNYGFVILDPGTGFAFGPFDTGIDYTQYYINDTYVLNHAGYAVFFRNHNDNSYKVQFIDGLGTIVETMDASSGLNYDQADGYQIITTDYQNGRMRFFNGIYVGEYNWDTNIDDVYWDWNYDATSKDRSFIIYSRNYDTDLITWKIAHAENGVVDLTSYYSYNISAEPILYTNGNSVVIVKRDSNNGYYSSLEIYDTSGDMKQNVDLTSFNTNTWDMGFYGSGKVSFIFFNNSDSDVDYQIFSHEEVTNKLLVTSHVRGNNYQYFDTYYQTLDYYNIESNNDTITYMFYSSWNNNNNLYYMDYVDFVTLYDGHNTYNVNTLSNGSSVGMSWSARSLKYYIDLVDTGDGKLKSMTIFPSGFTYTEILSDVTTLNNRSRRSLGDDMVYFLHTNGDYNTALIYVIDHLTGGFRDTVTLYDSSTYGYDWYYDYDTIYIYNYDGTQAYYMCRDQRTFASIGVYDYKWTSNNVYINENTFTKIGVIVLFNPNSDLACRIISPTGISTEFTLPSSTSYGWDLNILNNFISYRYQNGSNLPTMRLIDFSGNTLIDYASSSDTGWNFWTTGSKGNVVCVVTGEGYTNGTLNATIVNPNGTTSFKTLSYSGINNYWLNVDDYTWWC
jgi:hypothetical protein